MKKGIIFVLFLLVTVMSFTKENFKTYNNDRFNFKIDIPSSFSIQEADNGDGVTLTNEKGDVKFIAYGTHMVLIGENLEDASLETLKKLYENNLKKYGKNATYKVFKNDFFIISYVEDNEIIYEKVFYNKLSESICTYNATYTLENKKNMDNIVSKMSMSFKEN